MRQRISSCHTGTMTSAGNLVRLRFGGLSHMMLRLAAYGFCNWLKWVRCKKQFMSIEGMASPRMSAQ